MYKTTESKPGKPTVKRGNNVVCNSIGSAERPIGRIGRLPLFLSVATLGVLLATSRPAHALVIVPSFDPSWSAAPVGATTDVDNVIAEYETDFINPATITVSFGWGTLMGYGALSSGAATTFPTASPNFTLGQTKALYATAVGLQPTNTTLATANKNLPATFSNPSSGSSNFFVSDAQYKALTGVALNKDPIDGFTGYATNFCGGGTCPYDFSGRAPASNAIDFTAVVEHEVSHAMGRVDYAFASPNPRFLTPQDFFKYTSNSGVCGTTLDPTFKTTCFSVDGGATNPLKRKFSNTSDSGDWIGATGDAYNAFINKGQFAAVSTADIGLMHALGWTPAAPCIFECINQWSPHPLPSQATSLTTVLAGNVVGQINVAATQNNPLVNPFAYENQNFHGGTGTSSITVTLDMNGNTIVTYSGSNPILSTDQFQYGPQENGNPHFGYEGSGNEPVLGQFWSNLGTNTALPLWSAVCPASVGPIVQHAVLYGEVTAGGQTGGQWQECAEGLGPLTWTITNPSDFAETFDNFGFFTSPIEIDLTFLNYNGLPPPEVTGSEFTPLSELDGLNVPGGGSVSVTVEPEPASLAILGVALVGFGFARRRKVA